MQTTSKLSNLFISGLSLLIFACNSSKKDEPKNDQTNNDTANVNLPPPPPPKVEMEPAAKECFANDGLKYNTVVTINIGGSQVTGNVTSEEMGSGTKQTADFSGTIGGDTLTVTFKGTAPVVGDASEWTNKPWIIKKTDGKEKLLIVFNAKNYDTNKWENTTYEFDPCK